MANEVILSAILFPIKSSAASAAFWTTRLETVLATPKTTKNRILLHIFCTLVLSSISFFYYTCPIISVIFTLSSTSSDLLFWSGNCTWMNWNSALVVSNIANEWVEIVVNWPNCLLVTKVNNTLDACWQVLLTKLQCAKTTSTDSSFGTSSPSLSSSTTFFYFLIVSLI